MERIVHDLISNTPEWHAFRLEHDGASEAAAMLGLSKNVTRTELLDMKATGLPREFSDFVQKRILDKGHEVEALARPLVEAVIGDDLYPVTLSMGRQSASCDGLTMNDETGWENKQWNEAYAAMVRAGQMPEEHMPQVQQGLKVSGAKRWIFSISDGTPDKFVWMEVLPDPVWFERLDAGWIQFNIDRAAHVPTVATAPVVATPVQALPAVSVRVEGTIAVFDNFDKFEAAVRDFIEHRLIRTPKSDQDFADLDTQIKAMKGAREAIKAGKAQMLAQIEPVDVANKRADMLDKLLQTNQSMAEKLLESEKQNRRTEIVTKPAADLRAYMTTLNRELGAPYIPMPSVDFGGAIKGMRSLSSMEDAVATLLANAKIDANAVAATVRANLKLLDELGTEHAFLFADKAQLVLKATDDFKAVATQRVENHKRAEADRIEKERERIRAEEKAKLEREQAEAAQKLIDDAAAARRDEQNAAGTAAMQGIAEARQEDSLPAPVLDALEGVTTSLIADLAVSRAAATSANVVPMRAAAPAPAAAPATPPTMKLGDINALLSPIALTADGLTKLGFPPAAVAQNAKLYHHRDLSAMCAALHDLLDRVQAKQAA